MHDTNSSYGHTTLFHTVTKQVITDIFTITKLSDMTSYGVICIVKGNIS